MVFSMSTVAFALVSGSTYGGYYCSICSAEYGCEGVTGTALELSTSYTDYFSVEPIDGLTEKYNSTGGTLRYAYGSAPIILAVQQNGEDICFECLTEIVEEYKASQNTDSDTDEGDYETLVSYTGDSKSVYEVTVPATLAPGGSGEVKVSGTWASNMTVKVTASETVTLTNDIDGSTKTLDVEFDGISQAGDNTNSILVNATISVEEITNALFGTWSGTIYYNVELVQQSKVKMIRFFCASVDANGDGGFNMDDDYFSAEEGMTWAEWVESEYNTYGYYINQYGIVKNKIQISVCYSTADHDFGAVHGADVIIPGYEYGD